MCHKNNEVLWLRLLRRGGGGEEGVGEGGGGRGEEKRGEGSRHGRRSCFTLSPPNPAPPYKPAEIGQQVGSVLLLKTQPGHRYLLSLNTSQVKTA